MHEAFLLVAVILFVLSGIVPIAYREGPGWGAPSLVAIGLAFFAAAFLQFAS